MVDEKVSSTQIIERLMSSYGVTSQKSLAESLGIPANNISGWVQRDSVPGNAIIKCALDTGTDLEWLVTGKLANASLQLNEPSKKGKALLDEILSSGGKAVLRRILDAYGFKTQKELGDLLGISSGTISTWIRRDYFPGDVVITCALDTGVSLEWLATGNAKVTPGVAQTITNEAESFSISKKLLIAGKLEEQGSCIIDSVFLPEGINKEKLCLVRGNSKSWVVNLATKEISNGSWLLDIDGTLDVYSVSRRPGNQLRIIGNNTEFDCAVDQVVAKGVVVITIKQNI
ncbi:MAG: phage repressor protein CI [Rouxiella aceris]|uniref:phage repressor protein CI n=1 Tax=Rouxiella aceris TaxID=2703884 RepID=UPI0028474468|nr:phage repressor protein CI [Rouxiella aceris]MDR3432083.1 phage repressor protein CI [Rouxiella aceris]